jgi:hypothetical protein
MPREGRLREAGAPAPALTLSEPPIYQAPPLPMKRPSSSSDGAG